MPSNSKRHRRTPAGNLMPAPRERKNAAGVTTSLQVNSPNFKRNGEITNEKIGAKTLEQLMVNYDLWLERHADRSMVAKGTETIESFGKWFIGTELTHRVAMGELSPNTLVNYRIAFEKRICDPKFGCGWLRIRSTKLDAEANHENLTDWVRRMQKAGVPLATMEQAVKTMRSLGRAMVEHSSKSGTTRNPAKFLEYPATDTRTAAAIEEVVERETDPVVTAALRRASEQLPVHLSGLWTICTGTGMRRGELCGLKWDDIDFEGGWIKVQRQVIVVDTVIYVKKVKNDGNHRGRRATAAAPKLVPLDPRVAEVLLRMKGAQELLARGKGWGKADASDPERSKHPGPWVFSEDGLVMRPSRMHYLFGTVKRSAGVGGLTLHDGRHDFISYLHSAGLAPDQVAAYARHKDPQTMWRAGYVHKVKHSDEGRQVLGRVFDMLDEHAQAV